MSFDDFQSKVNNLVRPLGMSVIFRVDNGRYYANISDGTVITANSVALSVMIRWGSGHTAIAQL